MTFEMVIIPLTYIAVNYIKKWELVEEKKWLPLIAMVLGAFLGIGFGALSPAFQTLAVRSAAPSRAGVATATYFWSLDISVGLAAAIMSIVAASYGYPFMYSIANTSIVILTAICYGIWRYR